MKAPLWSRRALLRLMLAASLAGLTLPQGLAQDEAHIVRIQTENEIVLVTVAVPEGLRKITLESRVHHDDGTWQPRAVARINGQAAEITFRLPMSSALELLRVRADASEPLPASFYEGVSAFNPEPGQGYNVRYLLEDGTTVGANPDAGAAPPEGDREVVESDIWKLSGDTLYVFNQYRGLQVIGMSDPDEPTLLGGLNLAAQGEEMILLGDHHAILLASNPCAGDPDGPQSEIVIAQVETMPPSVAITIPLAGTIRESRLIGNVLYVATESYENKDDQTWEWGITLSAYDLADPSAPVAGDRRRFSGSGLVVGATPHFFFVAAGSSDNRYQSLIRCFDITDPGGRMVDLGSVRVFGSVADKFKLNWHDGVLRVVSATWDSSSRTWLNRLETFRLPSPGSPQTELLAPLGAIDLGRGERLFATRFDGARAYVVTYFVIDPLWVVDLVDPRRPRVVGELHVPGWSTYIHPMGEHLIAIGIDDTNGRRTAVSLFDVSNPARPALVKRISLGEGYSWSEANSTEKAFTVLPDEQLILVPYTGQNEGVYGSRVQLIDFDLASSSLGLRGEILHRFGARRSTVHRERMISVSNLELLTVDITDRDQPEVTSELVLAWSTDDVFLHDKWLVQLTRGNTWNGESALHVSIATDPENLLYSVPLEDDRPVLGAAKRGGWLLVMQGELGTGPVGDSDDPASEEEPNFRLTVFDLAKLAEELLPVLGHVEAEVGPLGWGSDFQFLWIQSELLVLAGGGGYGWYYPMWDVPVGGPDIMPRFYWGGSTQGGNRFIAVDLTDPGAPRVVSDLTLDVKEAYGFSPAHVAGDLVYLSHSKALPPGPIEVVDPATRELRLLDPPEWFRVSCHELDVIDYGDPVHPDVREPRRLPGRLEAIGRVGALLYTRGVHWTPKEDWSYDSQEWLDAVAYDGTSVYEVASLSLPSSWPQPLLVRKDRVYLGQPAEAGDGSGMLQVWVVTDAKEFTVVHRLPLEQLPYSLNAINDLLLGSIDHGVRILDLSTPEMPADLGIFEPEGCVWLDPVKAKGSRAQGQWFPLGLYGTWQVVLPDLKAGF